MTPTVVLLTALSILLDVIGQLAFKLGLDQLPEHEDGFRLGHFWRQIAGAPLLWCGVSAYVIEFITWLFVLSLAPLSLVFPAASLSYVGVVLGGRLVLGETVSRRRWLGTLVITTGVMLVCATGA
ncbi:transporter [Pseudomonas abietaniphila]|uniref:transporter n=1 Tax=Pseudomonas abietaniphila TaxID=89065 RepID=UPI00321758B5